MPERDNFYPATGYEISTILSALCVSVTLMTFAACTRSPEAANSRSPSASPGPDKPQPALDLSSDQLRSIQIEPVSTYPFTIEKKAIGSIEFDNKLYFDNAGAAQVYPPADGTIVENLAELGDAVAKDQPLYVISTPKEPRIEVSSPITGQVTAVNATKGLFVQRGKAPAPYAVADVATKWMIASTPETDSAFFRIEQPAEVRVQAYSERAFEGKVSKIFPTIDGNTHRVTIRITVADPANELRAGMLGEASIQVRRPLEQIAIPEAGVVREPDGATTVWVTTDRHHFSQRPVKTGLRQTGRVEILEGLGVGELVVTDGAIFLDNMLQAPPSD